MRCYVCSRCGQNADFAASRCGGCGVELAFWPDRDEFVVLDDRPFHVGEGGQRRCLNAAWGCNWVVQADSGEIWCRSCRLTRSRPDIGRPDAIAAWEIAEGVKRRLVRHLVLLGLPIEPPAPNSDDPGRRDEADGVVFDLVHLPDKPGMTGHRRGVITLDLREVEDEYRERVRVSLAEPERTVLGHLRHEVGHHYWRPLVDAAGDHAAFRALFGDERADYNQALELHYRRPMGPPPEGHITSYAKAHPAEDWAETFAHYLAIHDGIETVEANAGRPAAVAGAPDNESGPGWVEHWRAISATVNAVTIGLGHSAPYPYRISDTVAAKLAYIHDRIVTATPPADGTV